MAIAPYSGGVTASSTVDLQLRPYQLTAEAFLRSHPRAVLGDPPGTGKTPVAAMALQGVDASRILVVSPNSVVHHWEAVLAQWFPHLSVVDGRGSRPQRARAREAVGGGVRVGSCPHPPPTALVLNYESFRQDADELIKLRWDTLVADEGHRLKNRTAQVTRAAFRFGRRIPRVWLLTGTPIVNRPDEAWSLLHLLHPDRFPSYWRWVETWMTTDRARFPGRSQWAKVITGLRPGAIDGIHRELADVLIQRPLEELLPDLPPATITRIEVDLDAAERSAYEDLRRQHWTQLDDGTVVQTVNEVSRITRFRQLVSNMEALGARRPRPGSKISAALDLVDDLDPEQVVVLTWSRSAAERVADLAGGVYVHGGVPRGDRQGVLDTFQRGKARVLSGTLATLGEGVDGLQVARHIVMLDRPWRPSDEDQAIGRIRRSGQVSAVSVWVLVARNTIDVEISKLLDEKRSVIDAITKGEL